MFDYDKLVKKLKKFNDLPGKKQKKILEQIFISDEFRDWFYGMGENATAQPMTSPMVAKIFSSLSAPNSIKKLTKFVEKADSDRFDHTACTMTFLAIEQAVDASNKATRELSDSFKSGEVVSKEAKSYKEKSEKYNELIAELMEALREKAKPDVKEICKKSNLPKAMVYSTYFMVPGRKYIPKYKIGMYMNQLLQEIYKWTGNNGMDDIGLVRWGSYFGAFFGNDLTTSAAISVLLEGVRRIDPFREMEHFEDVREVWDSLTTFAMSELDNAPENVRRQMIELYMKRIDKIFHNGNGPRLRVDMLNVPNDFQNLARTLSNYSDRIAKITRSNANQINNTRREYQNNDRRPNRDERRGNVHRDEQIPKIHVPRDEEEEVIPSFTNLDEEDDEDEDDDD